MSAQRSKLLKVLVPLVVVLAVVCIVAIIIYRRSVAYAPPPLAFDGPSGKLQRTIVVPTLDARIPKGINVIWCASFQLAWNEFRDDVIGEPVKIEGAQEIADRLNASTITAAVLEPEDYYAKAGYVDDGAAEKIERDMTARFPDVTLPEFEVKDPDLVAVMYAYLAANVKFTTPFYENDEGFLFDGVPVSSFGISATTRHVRDEVLRQVEVLYESSGDHWSPDDEFIIDPCKHTKPYQIILARIAPKATLAETLADLNAKLAQDLTSGLYEGEPFLVPNLHWKVTRRFRELEGADKHFQNEGQTGRWLEELYQATEFRVDRGGAEIRSSSWGRAKESAHGERRFVFNRPFLIVMRKRGVQQPFFVMWVDNAELLCKP